MSDDLQSILGECASSPKVESLIQKLSALASIPRPSADVKSYADAVYHNFYALGISLMFVPPTKGTRVGLEQFVCDSIDVMNVPDAEAKNTRAAKTGSVYHAFPGLPLSFEPLIVTSSTAGAEFVRHLGEPGRKGGGGGAAGPGIWCEWPGRGLMVEFGGDEARGPDAWDKGGKAIWSVVTLFRVGSS